MGCSDQFSEYLLASLEESVGLGRAETLVGSVSRLGLSLSVRSSSGNGRPNPFAKSGNTAKMKGYGGNQRGGRGKRRFVCPPPTRNTHSKRTGEAPVTINVRETKIQWTPDSNEIMP